MRALVTGGAGFIGSHLVSRLQQSGWDVTILDDLSVGRREFLPTDGSVRFVIGDVRDQAAVVDALAGCELVFHLAAIVGVRRIVEDPLRGIQVNVNGTESVLAAAFELGARVVIASSSEVYGVNPSLPLAESSQRVLGPTSVSRWSYATSKALDEHLLFAYRDRGLKGTIVRYFNTYGPRQDSVGYAGVVATFTAAAVRGSPIEVHGDGSQTRSFCFVEDTADGTFRAGTVSEAEGQVFNIGNDREITIAELAALVNQLGGGRSPIVHRSFDDVFGPDFQDPARRKPDISQARERLGFDPKTTLEAGLRRTLEWAASEQSNAPGLRR